MDRDRRQDKEGVAQLSVGRGGEARRRGLEHSAQMSTFVLSAAVPGRGGGGDKRVKGD